MFSSDTSEFILSSSFIYDLFSDMKELGSHYPQCYFFAQF